MGKKRVCICAGKCKNVCNKKEEYIEVKKEEFKPKLEYIHRTRAV